MTSLAGQALSQIMLSVIDEKWKDHLYDLDQLRAAIQYRAWGQKDPLIEYKQEAYEMFVGITEENSTELPSPEHNVCRHLRPKHKAPGGPGRPLTQTRPLCAG